MMPLVVSHARHGRGRAASSAFTFEPVLCGAKAGQKQRAPRRRVDGNGRRNVIAGWEGRAAETEGRKWGGSKQGTWSAVLG